MTLKSSPPCPQAGDWSKASDANWTVDGRAAGTVRQVGPLAFMRVFEAGAC